MIREGRISVNGVVCELGTQIDPQKDKITIDGKPLGIEEAPPRVYWLLHKPDRTLTSTVSQGDKATIFDLPALAKIPFKLSSVGRLDYRTEGLLLLSNDGEFIHRLSHPSFKMPRHYRVLSSRRLEESEEKALTKGVELEDGPVKGVQITYAHSQKLARGKSYWYLVTVLEGRNRLVRRLFEKFDAKVIRLIRYRFGDLILPEDLEPGSYRQLKKEELKALRRAVDLV